MLLKNSKKAVIWLVLVMVCMFSLAGCGVDDIDVSGYGDSVIKLEGLGSDQEITVAELKELDCVTVKTHSTSDKIGEVKATGPELNTVLEKFGVSKEDFSSIHFYGEDDYDIKLTKDYISEHDIILAFGINGEPLEEDSTPLRIIIPESDSAYWIRMVSRIQFKK